MGIFVAGTLHTPNSVINNNWAKKSFEGATPLFLVFRPLYSILIPQSRTKSAIAFHGYQGCSKYALTTALEEVGDSNPWPDTCLYFLKFKFVQSFKPPGPKLFLNWVIFDNCFVEFFSSF